MLTARTHREDVSVTDCGSRSAAPAAATVAQAAGPCLPFGRAPGRGPTRRGVRARGLHPAVSLSSTKRYPVVADLRQEAPPRVSIRSAPKDADGNRPPFYGPTYALVLALCAPGCGVPADADLADSHGVDTRAEADTFMARDTHVPPSDWSAPCPESLYSPERVRTYHITVHAERWQAIRADPTCDLEVPAELAVDDEPPIVRRNPTKEWVSPPTCRRAWSARRPSLFRGPEHQAARTPAGKARAQGRHQRVRAGPALARPSEVLTGKWRRPVDPA